jgi:acetyl esterase/lipase
MRTSAEGIRELAVAFGRLTKEPSGVAFEEAEVGGIAALSATPASASSRRKALLFHGGGYASGSIATHRRFAGHLAVAVGMEVLMLDYRLAPEHPYPAALDDGVRAYAALLALGSAPHELVLVGDSAGGGLALAVALQLAQQSVPMPAGVAVASPWVDLNSASMRAGGEESSQLSVDALDTMAQWYLNGRPADDPLASPLRGDLSVLPPLLIQVGAAEVLLVQSRLLAERATSAGALVTLEIWPEMFHVFQMGAGRFPEADAAVARIGSWLGDVMSAAERAARKT